MHFRLALPADAPAIAALHAASWAIAYAHILRADWLAQDLEDKGLACLCQALFATNEFVFVD